MIHYLALVDRAGDGTYGVAFPDLPGCTSAGGTADEAVANASEALLYHLEAMAEDGDTIPVPSALDAPLPGWVDGDLALIRVLVPVEMPGEHGRYNVTLPKQLVHRIDRMFGQGRRSGFLAEAADRSLRELGARQITQAPASPKSVELERAEKKSAKAIARLAGGAETPPASGKRPGSRRKA